MRPRSLRTDFEDEDEPFFQTYYMNLWGTRASLRVKQRLWKLMQWKPYFTDFYGSIYKRVADPESSIQNLDCLEHVVLKNLYTASNHELYTRLFMKLTIW